jgi:uncharacterized damage-inducible protein DinB
MNDGIRFSELLAYNEEETHRWKEWFAQNPTALDLPLDIADAKNVHGLLLHIFLVEVHFAHIVLGLDRVDFQAVQREIERGPAGNRDSLFAISEDATAKYKRYLANAPTGDLATTIEVSPRRVLSASKRKLITQALTHSMRHWAQLSTFLRQQGFKQPWVHDFLMSKAME